MVPAAGVLAALLVFGLDTILEKADEAKPASIEASVKNGPFTTGSVSQAPPAGLAVVAPVEATSPRYSQPMPPAAPMAVPAIESSEIHLRPSLAPAKPAPEVRGEASRPALNLSPEEIAVHLARGEERLKAGELAAARLYFERVALSGDPRGALGMARTYDPAVLAGLPILGPRSDPAAARQWYQRAATQRTGG